MLQLDEVDQAIESLEKAVKLDERYGAAHYLLGTAYQRQGRSEQAAQHFRFGQRTRSLRRVRRPE